MASQGEGRSNYSLDTVLQSAGYRELANEAFDNKISTQEMRAVRLRARKEFDRFKLELTNKSNAQLEIYLDPNTKAELLALVHEVEKGAGSESTEYGKEWVVPREALPFAPTTAFNVMRLVQLGFFPAEYSEAMKGNWGNIKWWNVIGHANKVTQTAYVQAGKLARKSEGFSDNIWLSIFDKWSKYGLAMRDILDGMRSELDAWHSQNKMPESRYQAARAAIDAMQTAHVAGNYDEMLRQFDVATTKLGLNENGKWHEQTQADRDAKKATLDRELSDGQTEVNRLQKEIDDSEVRTKANTKRVEDLNQEIERLRRDGGLSADLVTGKEALARIDDRIAAIDREIALAASDPYNSKFSSVAGYNHDLAHAHTDARAAIPVIESTLLSNGRLLSSGAIMGGRTNDLRTAKAAYSAAKIDNDATWPKEADKHIKILTENSAKDEFNRVKDIGDTLYKILEYRRAVDGHVTKLMTERDTLVSDLRPKVEERETKLADNTKEEKDRTKHTEDQAKKSAEMTSKMPGYSEAGKILSELADPDLGEKKRQNLNARLTELIGTKDPQAARLLTSLSTAPKWVPGDATRVSAISELRTVLERQEKAYEKVKDRLDATQKAIDAQRTKITDMVKDYDNKARTAKEAGDVAGLEALREEAARVIKQESAVIDKMNASAKPEFDAAKIELSPLAYKWLVGTSKVASVFHALEGFNNGMENHKAWGKVGRFWYGTLMLAGIGQIGMTATQDSWKAAKYAGDMAAGFLPFGIGGVYDIAMGAHQFFSEDGKNIWTGDKVDKTDAALRIGFWVLWVVTFGASNVIKAFAKADKAYDIAKGTLAVTKATSNVYILYETGHLGYGLFDAYASFTRDPSGTMDALKKNDELPYQREWHWFVVPDEVKKVR